MYMIITKVLFMKFLFVTILHMNISARHYSVYKFTIKPASLLKYFKSSSLFCNNCHRLNFTFAAFHIGNSEDKSS